MSGFAFGLGLNLAGVSWVYVSLNEFGHMPAVLAAVATFLFCAYLSLFPAAAAWASHRLAPAGLARTLAAMPAAFVLLEWVRGWLFTGFPWLVGGLLPGAREPAGGIRAGARRVRGIALGRVRGRDPGGVRGEPRVVASREPPSPSPSSLSSHAAGRCGPSRGPRLPASPCRFRSCRAMSRSSSSGARTFANGRSGTISPRRCKAGRASSCFPRRRCPPSSTCCRRDTSIRSASTRANGARKSSSGWWSVAPPAIARPTGTASCASAPAKRLPTASATSSRSGSSFRRDSAGSSASSRSRSPTSRAEARTSPRSLREERPGPWPSATRTSSARK